MGGQVARGQASDVGPVVRGEEAEPPPVRHGRRIRSRMPLRPLSSGPHRVSPRSSRTRLSTRLGGTRQSSRQPARTLTGKTSRSGPLELPRGRPINLHCISTPNCCRDAAKIDNWLSLSRSTRAVDFRDLGAVTAELHAGKHGRLPAAGERSREGTQNRAVSGRRRERREEPATR